MLKTRQQVNHQGVRARDLPGLMELYELNYIQLRRLIPDLDILPQQTVSEIRDGLDLHLTVMERAPYTSTLRLTYQFSDDEGEFPAPDVVVRLYHDAQVAEVISRGRRRGRRHAEYDRAYHHYPMEMKWESNRFLQKWLAYCLRNGHSFSPGRIQFSDALQAVGGQPLVGVDS